MVKTVSEVLEQTYFKLLLLSSHIKNKIAYEMLNHKMRALFNRWKRVTFLQQFASGLFDEKENQSGFTNTQLPNQLLQFNGTQPMAASVLDYGRSNLEAA